ncbi:ortholog of Bordetella pertussis (BX470248) BP3468 [plant metagenome]|uniref:Ortholog of Bordetella pertussis (BX470248) BP3468 n=1 Tax=plant metagenome TaxID=1297885 RepID=A0A484V2F9_9ZZZZ
MTSASLQPVAACGPVAAADAAYDRRWLVVDASGTWLTAQAAPALSRVTPSMKLGYLVLRAPGMLRLDIPLDVIEDDDSVRRVARVADQDVDVVDEGDLAAAWFSNVAGQPCRLVKLHPDAAPVAWPAG